MHTVGPGSTITDHMDPELAARRLDGDVHLPGRHADPLGHQLEVMDESFHRRTHDLGDVLG
ncbi:Uncharacterised protein [Mycobacteroides abscessus subsp. massiliense]|nr:Uncharacterised protein [Mycobacteroides abscessus subsp. massiliense]